MKRFPLGSMLSLFGTLLISASMMSGCGGGAIGNEEDETADADELRRGYCGNGRCSRYETCLSCAQDCGRCQAAPDMSSAPPDLSSAPPDLSSAPPDLSSAPPDLGGPSFAHHLYVSTTGSDSAAGTQAAPLRTISKASALAVPDTAVHVAPGTYAGNVVTQANGTSSARIRYISDVRWGAKIVGSGTESAWANHGDYVDIVGFDITGTGRLGILNWASFARIEGNHVHDLTLSGGCTGAGGAGIVNADYTKSDDDVVGNLVHDIGVPGACNGVQGIYSSNLRGRIENNVVYRASSYGIHLWHAADAVRIVNNTVFDNGSASMGGGIVIGSGDSPGGIVLDHTIVANNIVVGNKRASILEYCYSGVSCIGPNNHITNNLVFGNGSGISLRVGTATGTITADPQFVNDASDWHLKSTSPAIDAGAATYAPAADFDGVSRPRGAGIDIGAFER